MILLLALACRPDPPPGPASPASWVEDDLAVSRVEVIGASGGLAAVARLHARNDDGAGVFGGVVSATVDGVPVDVEIGAQGYGELTIALPGSHVVEVGGVSSEVHVYGAEWPGFGLFRGRPAPMTTTIDAVPAGAGVLTHVANQLWWTGPEGRSHVVLAPLGTIGGVANGHLDGDGVLDAIAWSEGSVFLLRGHSGGGLFYGGELASESHAVAGAALGDASNDGLADLVVAWVGGPLKGRIDVWEGDGLLGFSPTSNRLLGEVPVDVAVGDNQGSGQNVVTVNLEDGNWNRFYRGPSHYAPAGPSLDISLPVVGRTFSLPDLIGTGASPLFFTKPYLPDTLRETVMFDLTPGAAQFINLQREGMHLTWAELDGDGLYEIVMYDDAGTLVGVHLDPEDGDSLTNDGLINLNAAGGPVAVFPDTTDILIASTPDWLTVPGGPTQDAWFAVDDRQLAGPGVSVPDGMMLLVELDGDPAPELLTMRDGGSARLRLWEVTTDSVTMIDELELEEVASEALDLVRCGTDVWVLLEENLHRVDFSDPEDPSVSDSYAVQGQRVGCGNGPLGPVAVLTGNEVRLLSNSLAEVGVVPAAGAGGLWLDEDGAITCLGERCEVVRAPVGPDGALVTIESSPEGATLDGATLHGAGTIAVSDVDGNGFPDLILHHEGRAVVHRHTGDALGFPEVYHSRFPMIGRADVGDLDGDGNPDLWFVDPDQDRLRVTGPPPTP